MRTVKLLALALAVQLICPFAVLAKPVTTSTANTPLPVTSKPAAVNLNLASTQTSISAAALSLAKSLSINVGGIRQTINSASLLTPAEYVAAYEVSTSGVQTLKLSSQGNASGGHFSLTGALSQSIGNLVVPQNVKLLENFALTPVLSLSGDLTDAGKIIAFSTSAVTTQATIEANDINVLSGGLITSALVSGLPQGAVSGFGLNLTALNNIANAGTISSAGNLNLSAGGSITNAAPVGVAGAKPSMQAAHNLNLLSANVTNAGMMSALAGNINFNTSMPSDLVINGAEGTFQALNGTINLRHESYGGTGNTYVTGGNLLSQALNVNAGRGVADVNVEQLTGTVNATGYGAHVTVATDTLKLGTINVVDPTFYNDNGSIDLTGNITVSEPVAIVASGDITDSGNVEVTISSSAMGDNGNITLVAGAAIDTTSCSGCTAVSAASGSTGNAGSGQSITVTRASATGGNIDLHNVTSGFVIDTAGNNVTLVAFNGTNAGANTGAIVLPPSSSITAAGSSSCPTCGVTIIAGGADGAVAGHNAIELGNIAAGGAGANGTITVSTSQPTTSGVTFDSTGAATGTFATTTTTAGTSVSFGSLASGALSIMTGGSATDNFTVTAGGAVSFSSGTNVDVEAGAAQTIINGSQVDINTPLLEGSGGGSVSTFAGTLTGAGYNLTSPASTFEVGSVSGSATFAFNGAPVSVSTTNLTIDNNATLSSDHAITMTVVNGGTFSNSGLVQYTGGPQSATTITLQDGGTHGMTLDASIGTFDPGDSGNSVLISAIKLTLANGGSQTLAEGNLNIQAPSVMIGTPADSGNGMSYTFFAAGSGDYAIAITWQADNAGSGSIGLSLGGNGQAGNTGTLYLNTGGSGTVRTTTSHTMTLDSGTTLATDSPIGMIINNGGTFSNSGTVQFTNGAFGNSAAITLDGTQAMTLDASAGQFDPGDPNNSVSIIATTLTLTNGGNQFLRQGSLNIQAPTIVVGTPTDGGSGASYAFTSSAITNNGGGITWQADANGYGAIELSLGEQVASGRLNLNGGFVATQSSTSMTLDKNTTLSSNNSMTLDMYGGSTLTNNGTVSAASLTVQSAGFSGTSNYPNFLTVLMGSGSSLQATTGDLRINPTVEGSISVIGGYGTLSAGANVTFNNVTTPTTESVTINVESISGGATTVSGGAINLTGNFISAGGNVFIISTSSVTTSGNIVTSSNTGNGGSVLITAGGSISMAGNIDTSSTGGNGGMVTLSNAGGGSYNLSIAGYIHSYSSSGSGGDVALVSADGYISTGAIDAHGSESGGSVGIAASGTISVNDISTYGVSSYAGNIFVSSGSSASGAVSVGMLDTSSGASGGAGTTFLGAANCSGCANGFADSNADISYSTTSSQSHGTPAQAYLFYNTANTASAITSDTTVYVTTGVNGVTIYPGVYTSDIGSSGTPVNLTLDLGGDSRTIVPIVTQGDIYLASFTGDNTYGGSASYQNNGYPVVLVSAGSTGIAFGGNVTSTPYNGSGSSAGNIYLMAMGSGSGVIQSSGSLNLQANNIILSTGGGGVNVSAPNNVVMNALGNIWILDSISTAGSNGNGGSVTLDAGSSILVLGINSSGVHGTGGSGANGGAVTITAGSSVSVGDGGINSSGGNDNGGAGGNGGAITIMAGTSVSVGAGGINSSGLMYYAGTGESGGNGGAVTITAGSSVSVGDGGIDSSADNDGGGGAGGNGGAVTIMAGSSVSVGANGVQSEGNNYYGAGGNGAAVTITAGTWVYIGDAIQSASLNNSGPGGNGGIVTITAGSSVSVGYFGIWSYSDNYFATGPGGNGGTVTITAGSDVSIGGIESYGYNYSGSVANGGAVTITAGSSVAVGEFGIISSGGNDGTGSGHDDEGTGGSGGAVTITAGSAVSFLGNGGIYSSGGNDSAAIVGNGGAVTIKAGSSVSFGYSGINSSGNIVSGTEGNGGAVTIVAGSSVSLPGGINSSGNIASGTGGNGGAVAITTGSSVLVGELGINSSGNCSSGAEGNGGAVTITAGSSVSVGELGINSSGNCSSGAGGNGGVVTITAGSSVLVGLTGIESDGSNTSSVTGGNGGAVIITAGSAVSVGSIYSGGEDNFGTGTGGNGGSVTITAGSSVAVGYGIDSDGLTSSGTGGNGGAATITAGSSVSVGGIDSNGEDYSGAETGGSGGAVTITAGSSVSVDGGGIYAYGDNGGTGTGGNGGSVGIAALGTISIEGISTYGIGSYAGNIFVSSGSSSVGAVSVGTLDTSSSVSGAGQEGTIFLGAASAANCPSCTNGFDTTGNGNGFISYSTTSSQSGQDTPGEAYLFYNTASNPSSITGNTTVYVTTGTNGVTIYPGIYTSDIGSPGTPVNLTLDLGGDSRTIVPIVTTGNMYLASFAADNAYGGSTSYQNNGYSVVLVSEGSAGIALSGNVSSNPYTGSGGSAGNVNMTVLGSGGISSTAGTISGSSVSLSSIAGNIGGSTSVVATQTGSLSTSGGGNVYLSSTGVLALGTAFAGGNFQLTTSGSVTLNNITTANGSINVVATTGTIIVAGGAQIAANGGNLTIQNSDGNAGSIVVENGANLTALSGSGAQVEIFLGSAPPAQNNPTSQSNVIVNNVSGGQTFLGTSGITASTPANTVTAEGSGALVVLNTGNEGASAIQLDGGVNIFAGVVNTSKPLTSLDLTNQALTTIIIQDQSEGTVGGTLYVNSSGVATGGTIILSPGDLASTITADNIPSGVTVTFQGFTASNPVDISLTGSSTTTQAIISGSETFASTGGGSTGVVAITSNQTGPVLVIASSGVLSSDGSLSVTVGGNVAVNGALSATGNLTLQTATSSNGNIVLAGNVTAGNTAAAILSANGSGTITQTAGVVQAGTVNLTSGSGAIGSVKTSTPSLTVNTTGSVTIVNLGFAISLASGGDTFSSLSVSNNNSLSATTALTAVGNVQLTASGSVTVNNITSTGGSVTVQAGGGTLTIANSAQVQAGAGNLIFQNTNAANGSILIGQDATLSDSTGSNSVEIFVGSSLTPGNPATPQSNVLVVGPTSQVFFGTAGITANTPSNTINVSDTNTVTFSTGTASAITLGGGVTINAGQTVAPLASLDLTQKSVTTALSQDATKGLLADNLTLNAAGAATGGSLTITNPGLLSGVLGLLSGSTAAIDIPKGVIVDFAGFNSTNAIVTNGDVVINGTASFTGATTSAVLDVNSTQAGTTPMLNVVGSLTSAGALSITVNNTVASPLASQSVLTTSGTLTANGALSLTGNGLMKLSGIVNAAAGHTLSVQTTTSSNGNIVLSGKIGVAGATNDIMVYGSGTITEGTGATLIGSTFNFAAGTGAIGASATPIKTTAQTLSFNSSGNVYASSTVATDLMASTANLFTLTSSGALSINGSLTVTGISAAAVKLTASTGGIIVSDPLSAGGGVALTATFGTIAIGAGLTAGTTMTLTASSATGAIMETAGGTLSAPTTITLTTGSAGGGIGTSSSPITIAATSTGTVYTTASHAGSSAYITGAGAVVVGATSVGAGFTLDTGGNITDTGAVTGTAIGLTSAGSIIISAALGKTGATVNLGITGNGGSITEGKTTGKITAGSLSLSTDGGNVGNFTSTPVALVISASALTIAAGGADSQVLVKNGVNVVLNGGTAGSSLTIDNTGAITVAATATTISAPATTLQSSSNIIVDGPVGSSSNPLTLQAGTSGTITAGASGSILASALTLKGGNMGTSSASLPINTATLAVTSGGAVYLNDGASVTLNASTAGATFALSDSGVITTAGTVSATSVKLTTTGSSAGSIILGANIGKAGGSTTLQAGGAGIIQAGTFAVLGSTVSLITAGGDIEGASSSSSLQASATTLTINTGSNTAGDVLVNNTLAVKLGASTADSFDLTANGKITVAGALNATDITLAANAGSNGGIAIAATIGTSGATANTELEADGSGAISQTAGLVYGQAITLQGGFGNIGASASAPIKLATAGTITSDTGTNGGTGSTVKLGSTYLSNAIGDATLEASQSGGAFSMTAIGSLTVDGVATQAPTATSNGTVTIVAGGTPGGELLINGNVSASGGSITLENSNITATSNSSIVINAGVDIHASSTLSTAGKVNIVMGPVPATPASGTQPGNVNPAGTAKIYYGANGIATDSTGGTIQLQADGRNIVFNTGALPSTAIVVHAGSGSPNQTTITADPPAVNTFPSATLTLGATNTSPVKSNSGLMLVAPTLNVAQSSYTSVSCITPVDQNRRQPIADRRGQNDDQAVDEISSGNNYVETAVPSFTAGDEHVVDTGDCDFTAAEESVAADW